MILPRKRPTPRTFCGGRRTQRFVSAETASLGVSAGPCSAERGGGRTASERGGLETKKNHQNVKLSFISCLPCSLGTLHSEALGFKKLDRPNTPAPTLADRTNPPLSVALSMWKGQLSTKGGFGRHFRHLSLHPGILHLSTNVPSQRTIDIDHFKLRLSESF